MDNFRIKEILKSKGITMRDLAQNIGIAPENLSASLNGNPTLNRLIEVSNILNVPVKELFKDENCPSGYLEYNGVIYKINSFDDITKFLDRTK